MFTRCIRCLQIGSGALLAGFGGGAAGPALGMNHSFHAGQAVLSYSGEPQPLITSAAGQISVYGQAGAAYSSLTYNPTANLLSTSIAFTRQIGASIGSLPFAYGQVYTVPETGAQSPKILYPYYNNNSYVTWSNTGVLAFLSYVGNDWGVETALPDGSSAKGVVSDVWGTPSISPNGATIIYASGNQGAAGANTANLFSVSSSGHNSAQIYSGGNAAENYPVIWNPPGNTIAFSGLATGGSVHVFTMGATGSATKDITPPAYANGDLYVSSWSPDGASIACTYIPAGATAATSSQVVVFNIYSGVANTLTPSNSSDWSPSFSPDNSEIAFYRSSSGGAMPGIYVEDFAGTNPQMLVPDPPSAGATGPVSELVWSPFPAAQTFVGTNGTLSSGASGFMMAQNAGQFGSLLTFTANTPSSAKIALVPASGANGPFLYTLTADSITNITYTNVYYGATTSVPLAGTTQTAVVSIDAATGQVDMIAPAQVVTTIPSTHSADRGVTTYAGQFTGLYDRSGKNLAPCGATRIQADPATGKLVSYR